MALFDFSTTKNELGVIRTKSLFYELSYSNTDNVIFTVKEHDSKTPCGKHLTSFPALYIPLHIEDPTDATFAEAVFGSFEVFTKIRNAPQLQDYFDRWQFEAVTKRKAPAFQAIVSEVRENGKGSLQAAKYLIEEPWIKDKTDGRGARKRSRETTQKAYEQNGLQEDLQRLRDEGLIN